MIYVIAMIATITILNIIYCYVKINIKKYTINTNIIEKNMRIIQLSDVHNRKLSKNIIKRVENTKPDIICLTGDIFEGGIKNTEYLLDVILSLTKIAQCYFVVGNHELRLKKEEYSYIQQKLNKMGVIILNNCKVLTDNNICIYGVGYNLKVYDNKKFNYNVKETVEYSEVEKAVEKPDETKYNIILSHSPFLFEHLVNMRFNLILSGHVHGGIICLPKLGGLLSPERTFFPRYYKGVYTKNDTNMVVNTGLGFGTIKVRLFNTPEIVQIDLIAKKDK